MSARIKVIGVGGAGGNAVSRMMKASLRGVELIVVNTDLQDLKKAHADLKLPIGYELTKGLGTGMNATLARKAAQQDKARLQGILAGAEMVFIAAGLGGGTGSGAAPVIAQFAKEQGILTIAVVVMPFTFEGASRRRLATLGLAKLKENVDAIITIENDNILKLSPKEMSASAAFALCDDVLRQAVQGITDLIIMPGIINLNFADVKAVMKNSGTALFGVGLGKGEHRAEKAVKEAANSPLLAVSAKGAKRVLFNIAGGKDLSLADIEEVAKFVSQTIGRQAQTTFGAIQDPQLKRGEIKVTLMATGF